MPNHPSVIARPTDTGFAGRYVHNDGHPTARIPLLRALYAGPFAGDLDAMTKFLLDDHPAGWSQIGAVHNDEFTCYCHGDRNEDPRLQTEDDTDVATADWVYILRADGIDVIDLDDGKTISHSWEAEPTPAPTLPRGTQGLALDPKDITGVDETTALGIATLWNDAIPAIHNALNRQIDDIEAGQILAGEDEDGLLTMAVDALMWIEDIGNGSPNIGPSDCPRLLSLVGDCLHVNDRVSRTKIPAYQLGSAYRLLAELADQTAAHYRAVLASEEPQP